MRANDNLRIEEPAVPAEGEALKSAIVDFARNASTEISTHDEDALPTLAATLPPGTVVYVAHTPKATLRDVVQMACKLQGLGLRASPHLVARRIESRQALEAGLGQLATAGVEQALLVAGDLVKPAGPYTSTLDIIDSGLLQNSSLRRLGVAGHPEGHKQVPDDVLLAALRRKQEFAARTGLKLHIATQFTFDPDAIIEWDARLTKEGITLPAHPGIAGPTPLPKLIKYAMACGVGASLNSVMKNMTAMAKLARLATTPDEMLTGLVRGGAARGSSRIVQPHFYAFGGVAATARWIRAVIDGNFQVHAGSGRFEMDA
ncbi:MAG TPA: methylenetetrahydrofolate reductase [Steroidobacteraceae bacterium]|nr:methylenetetrahydrofolate reductase [Steroidobacteraceae bacterium]